MLSQNGGRALVTKNFLSFLRSYTHFLRNWFYFGYGFNPCSVLHGRSKGSVTAYHPWRRYLDKEFSVNLDGRLYVCIYKHTRA